LSIGYEESKELLQRLCSEYPLLEVDPKRQVFLHRDEKGEKQFEFRPPLPFPALLGSDADITQYLDRIEEDIPSYILVLIQAGAASLGYFEDGEVIFHKAIKKYMTRKKQGKAQLNYLNTRGKSKAGSRVRLANTVRFFEEINQYLQDWEEYEMADKILYSCSARIWGVIFQASPPPPFDKSDPRLVRVPHDVHIPDHQELLRINQMALKGSLRIYQEVDL
jgi:hypothetical protein